MSATWSASVRAVSRRTLLVGTLLCAVALPGASVRADDWAPLWQSGVVGSTTGSPPVFTAAPPFYGGVGASPGSEAFIADSHGTGAPVYRYAYDPVSNTWGWLSATNLSFPRNGIPAASAAGWAFFAGGQYTDVVDELNGVSGALHSPPPDPLAAPRVGMAAALRANNR